MKRLALAVVGLTAFAVAAEAGSPFEPVRLVDHMRPYNFTHYVRGAEKGKKHGGGGAPTAEARQTAPAAAPASAKAPQKPQTAKAD